MTRQIPRERRVATRSQTEGAAVMCLPNEEQACIVVDISPVGAKLCTSRPRVPQRFNLRYVGKLFGCEVAWQSDTEIGVSFCEPWTEGDEASPTTELPATKSPKVGVRDLRSQIFGKR